jgi:hypothetical protein
MGVGPQFFLAEARGQFRNREEGKRVPLEAVARELVMTEPTKKTKCVL